MSDSRSVLLRLSVRDADVVRQELVALGQQGENALARLDAAAQRAGGTGGGSGGGGLASLRTSIGQAGFQIQDMVVQIQGGTSALTALSQQGSQFLGAFGPGGAIAGAVLTVGLLVAQFVGLGRSGADAGDAIKSLGKAMAEAAQDATKLADLLARVEARFMSTIEAARQQRIRALGTDVAALGARSNDLRLQALNRSMEASAAEEEMMEINLLLTSRNPAVSGGDQLGARDREQARRRLADLEGTITSARRDASHLEREALRLDADIQRTEALIRGEVSGDTNSNPGRADAPATTRRTASGLDPIEAILDRNRRRIAQENERDRDRYESILGQTGPAAAALRRFQDQQRDLLDLRERSKISEDEFGEAVRRTTAAYNEQMDQIERRGSGAADAARELGMSFSSAFEDAIVRGKDLRSVLAGIAQDIARIITRRSITGPLSAAASAGIDKLFSSSYGAQTGVFYGSGPDYTSASGGGFLFADGGIMTGRGPLSLRRYAGGGIADSPQLAMFGEGSTPEAYVPLPDGRSIPVTMKGAGHTFAPTYHIDARGADPSMLPRLRSEMAAIAQASVAQFADSINRGGRAAQLVGRR